jgi:hemin uptake protein HemP
MESNTNINRAVRRAEKSPPPAKSADSALPVGGHEIVPGKKFCEAGPGWCRVCEKMSDMPVLRSEDLLQGRREVLIIHGDELYRLLCTKNNKLILQK